MSQKIKFFGNFYIYAFLIYFMKHIFWWNKQICGSRKNIMFYIKYFIYTDKWFSLLTNRRAGCEPKSKQKNKFSDFRRIFLIIFYWSDFTRM